MNAMKIKTLDECMDVFEWFNDNRFEFARYIWLTKADAEERLKKELPAMRRQAEMLIKKHIGFEDAYPCSMSVA